MHRLTGLQRIESAAGIVVFVVPQIMNAPRGGPPWLDEPRRRPVRINRKKVAAWIERLIAIVAAGGQKHLEFNPVHKYRAVLAHDGIPLQIRAHEQVTLPPAIVGEGRARGIEIEGHEWHDHIHAPLAAQQYFLVGLVNELGEADPCIEFKWADLVAMLIGKLVRDRKSVV